MECWILNAYNLSKFLIMRHILHLKYECEDHCFAICLDINSALYSNKDVRKNPITVETDLSRMFYPAKSSLACRRRDSEIAEAETLSPNDNSGLGIRKTGSGTNITVKVLSATCIF